MPAPQLMDQVTMLAPFEPTYGSADTTAAAAAGDANNHDGPYSKQQKDLLANSTGSRRKQLQDCHSNFVHPEDDDEDQMTDNMEHYEAAELNPTPLSEQQQHQQHELDYETIKCSAVHSLERDMPDYDYSHLVRELRDRILKDCQLNVGLYAQKDIDKCKNDQWFIERFLLRQKLDLDKAFEMLRRTMRFRNESLAHSIRREDFPAEFYMIGGLFGYEEDRKGNKMLYVRSKIHRKIPEIQLVLQAFLYHNIDYLDEQANGKGIAMVLDCTGAGLANADLDMLLFLVSTLVNYFPKGMSYLLVHELPWILKPIWHLAKTWLSEDHRELIKFSNSKTIYEYVDRENLPDFMGGTCKRSYTQPPDNCTTLEEATKLWGIEPVIAKKILLKFAQYLPPEYVAKCEADNNDNDDGEGGCCDVDIDLVTDNNNRAADNNDDDRQSFDSDQENKGA